MSPDEVKEVIADLKKRFDEENERHLFALENLKKEEIWVQNHCPHSSTKAWFEYDCSGTDCLICGKQVE